MISVITDTKKIDPFVVMHYNAFKGRLSSELGKEYVAYFFTNLISSEQGIFYAYSQDDKVLGFVCGAIDITKFWSKKYKKKLGRFAVALILKNPLMLFDILKHMWVDYQVNKLGVSAHMLSFVVLEEYRGRGIGQKLVKAFSDFMDKQGIKSYLIPYTDANDYASRFYHKMGFRLIKTIDFFGHKDNCFIYDLFPKDRKSKA